MREVKRNHSVIFNVPSKTSVTDSIPTLEGSIGENEMPKRMSFAHRASIAVQTLRKGSIVAATTIWKQFRGVFYAFISSLLFSINSLIVKRLTGIDPALIASIRFAETGILAIAAIPEVNIDSIFGPPDSRICVFLRALTGATALYLRFVALKLLPLSNATVIKLTTPAFVSFFSVFILRESCGLGRVLTFTVTVIGIALTTQWHIILFGVNPHAIPSKVSQENDDRNSLMIGMSCGIIASMIGSLTVILLRKLKDVHHSVTLFNTSWIALIEMTAIAYFTDAYHLPECGPAPWFLMAVGVTSFFGQMMLTKALQVEEAGVVSMFKSSCDLILAFAYQILFFDHYPDGLTIFGSLLVLSGVLLTAVRKYLITLSKDKPLRQALNFLI